MTANNSADMLLNIPPYKGMSDFTLYVGKHAVGEEECQAKERIEKLLEKARDRAVSPPDRNDDSQIWSYSYSDPISLSYDGSRDDFRSLICSCFRNQYYSCTLRSVNNPPQGGREHKSPGSLFGHATATSNYAPAGKDEKPHAKFLFRLGDYNEVLGSQIFPTSDSRSGLVIVAGATAAGKSKLTRALIHTYLTKRISDQKRNLDRRPHLLTFEDPIETFYYNSPETAQASGLDYTPRQKGVDVRDLQQLCEDSLRQTPAAVYIGETRQTTDWGYLVDFAGKGHMVFTTCHAGSLTEVMSIVRTATGSGTASERSALASRLLAVVHIRAEKIQPAAEGDGKEAILPALWLRTSAGINFFTGDGLSAVLPHSAEDKTKRDARYCFGRNYFARKLASVDVFDRSYRKSLLTRAVELDLEGL
jgi:hypothetical protein